MQNETWAPIAGWSGKYEVSDQGRVRSLTRQIVQLARSGKPYAKTLVGRLLAPGVASNGYPTVALGRGNTRTVHSLVAEAFIGPCPAGKEVRHLDGNRLNPRLANLAHGTRSENILDAVAHGSWFSDARSAHLAKFGKSPAAAKGRANNRANKKASLCVL